MLQCHINIPVVCFGEVLWDVFHDEKKPGGAPFNVCAHLVRQKVSAVMISAVGSDAEGGELLDFVRKNDLTTDYIRELADLPTGTVFVKKDEKGDSKYTITQPVAWDNIPFDDGLMELVARSEFFIFGSLACRSEGSRRTLLRLLEVAPCGVFDVNFRAPHYDREIIEVLLKKSRIVKMNSEELEEIAGWYDQRGAERENMKYLIDNFNIEQLFVTRGGEGAVSYDGSIFNEFGGFQVDVKDTTGSGDAFLAAIITKYLDGSDAGYSLKYACAMGAMVATRFGAIPEIDLMKVEGLLDAVSE